MKALLIVDMQEGSFTPATPRHDADAIIRKINLLAEIFRSNGDKVVFIQHDGTKENSYIPGTHDWKLLSSLVIQPQDTIIAKTANDAFYKTELINTLKLWGITDLFITGCATDFCVDSTIHGALVNDYNVIVIKDCHTTADRPHLRAGKIIEHHNYQWANLTPTNGTITLVHSQDLLQK
jgi:nicotinamidase-related amidase